MTPAVPLQIKEGFFVCLFVHLFVTPTDLGTVSFSNCEDGDVRLVDGSNILEGRLEVCVNHVWGTVCSRGFGTEDAKVVCRKLGFASGILLVH